MPTSPALDWSLSLCPCVLLKCSHRSALQTARAYWALHTWVEEYIPSYVSTRYILHSKHSIPYYFLKVVWQISGKDSHHPWGCRALNRMLAASPNWPCQIQGGSMVCARDSSLWLVKVPNATTEIRPVFVCICGCRKTPAAPVLKSKTILWLAEGS